MHISQPLIKSFDKKYVVLIMKHLHNQMIWVPCLYFIPPNITVNGARYTELLMKKTETSQTRPWQDDLHAR